MAALGLTYTGDADVAEYLTDTGVLWSVHHLVYASDSSATDRRTVDAHLALAAAAAGPAPGPEPKLGPVARAHGPWGRSVRVSRASLDVQSVLS